LSIIGMSIALVGFLILNLLDSSNLLPEPKIIANGKNRLDMSFQKKYRGIITDKYIDINNRNYETIEIKLNDRSVYYWTTYSSDRSGFYNFIQVKDSIIKKDWGFEFFIKRKTIETPFVVNPEYFKQAKNE